MTVLLQQAYLCGDSYAPESNIELAELAGTSRSEVSDMLRDLRQRGLIHSAIVYGKRRIYPVDKDRNRTMPPDLPIGARPPRVARAPLHEGAHAALPTIGDPARVVVVQEPEINDPPEPPGQKRLADPAPTLALVQPMVIADQAAPAVHCVAAEATEQEPPAVAQVIEVPVEETPRLESWAGLVSPKAETPQSPEQQLRAGLSPAACAALDRLPAVERAKVIREFSSGPITPTSLSYYEKKLARPGAAGHVAVPERMTTAELIGGLPNCSDGSQPKIAAQRLANEFGTPRDQKLWTAFDWLMTAAWRGTVDVGILLFAFEKAMAKRNCENRGGYFWRVVQDKAGIKGGDLERLASGGRS